MAPEIGAAVAPALWIDGAGEEEAPWTVERIADAQGFEALAADWDELLAASPADGLFLTWEWLYTWFKHLGRGRRLALLAVRRGRELVALAPLAVPRPRPWPLSPAGSLQLLGTGRVGSDYLDLIARVGHERRAAEAMADYFARNRSLVELGQLPVARCSASLLAERLEDRGWTSLGRATNVCPYIDLAGRTWETYVAGLGKSHRQNLRRRLRQLEADFEVRFEAVESEDQLDEAFGVLLSLHRRRWSPRGGSDAFDDPALVAFHRELTLLALRRGWLRLYVLRLDGRPAAALYGFLYRGRFLYYQSGFDAAFARYSVGLVTMGLAIREAIREGAREYDLLHGDEPYKFLWADRTRTLHRLELYPPSLEAQLRLQVRRAVRRAKDRLRGWLGAAAVPVERRAGREALR